MPAWDKVWINANLATMTNAGHDYGAIRNAAMAVKGDRIAWIGEYEELNQFARPYANKVYQADGKWITPGLIDCHTHLVYGGNRAHEFEMRLQGAGYEELMQAGAGLYATVNATRHASENELLQLAQRRLHYLLMEGVTTIEIKSGYGLDTKNEIKMLNVARKLGKENKGVDVVTTFLGAHAIPPEFANNRKDYMEILVKEMLPTVAGKGLADAVDAFCESIAFTCPEVEQVFDKAGELHLPVKLHADQLSDNGGAGLAAGYNALSADHLEYTSEQGVRALAESGTVAVLLPGAFYTLRGKHLPPVGLFREYGVPLAVATDTNPGSSPILSILAILNMSCTLFSLTPAEALAGITRNAASAIGQSAEKGTLETGKRADFVIWDIQDPAELAYMLGANPCTGVVKDGNYSEVKR